jgi:hypothetical protein
MNMMCEQVFDGLVLLVLNEVWEFFLRRGCCFGS